MIVQEHFDLDFARKKSLPAPGFEPTSFLLTSSCQGIAFLADICLFQINHFPPYLVATDLGGT